MKGTTTAKHSHPLGVHSTMNQCNEKFRKRAVGWCLYYDDEKWKKKLLFVASPVLPTRNTLLIPGYLNLSVCSCVNVRTIYLLLVLTQILRLLFASFMYASVNLVSFLYNNNENILPMDCQ